MCDGRSGIGVDRRGQMSTITVCKEIDEANLAAVLLETTEKLEGAKAEIVLDLSCVRRIDCDALHALSDLAIKAEERSARVMLRGVDVDIYKALKLMKLTSQFAFVD